MNKFWRRILCAIGIHSIHTFDRLKICGKCRYRYRVLDTGWWDLDITDTQWVFDIEEEPACQVPPAGWFCSREAGHEGPCAAYRA